MIIFVAINCNLKARHGSVPRSLFECPIFRAHRRSTRRFPPCGCEGEAFVTFFLNSVSDIELLFSLSNMIRRLEEWNLRWIEEPINPMDDYDGLRFVRERSNLLLAAGENEYTHFGFKSLIEKQAADLLQPDIIKTGGLLCGRKILALAEAWNLQLIPHSYYYGPGVAATAHFVMELRSGLN